MSIRADTAGEYLSRTTSLPSASAFTACGWFIRRVDPNSFKSVVSLDNGGAKWIILQTGSTGDTLIVSTSGADSSDIISSIVNDEWIFWAVTSDGGTVNGFAARPGDINLSTASITVGAFTPSRLTILTDFANGLLSASVAHLKMYDAVLTQTELEAEMRQIPPKRFGGLHLWNPFLSSSNVKDYSGNGRDWTTNGTLSTEDNPPVGWGSSVLVHPSTVTAAVVPVLSWAPGYAVSGGPRDVAIPSGAY